jgi:hypothetical protein
MATGRRPFLVIEPRAPFPLPAGLFSHWRHPVPEGDPPASFDLPLPGAGEHAPNLAIAR